LGDALGDECAVESLPQTLPQLCVLVPKLSTPSRPIDRDNNEICLFRDDASPMRSRLIITAIAACTGVSCIARPGCAGSACTKPADRKDSDKSELVV
tara:strand:+ start:127 stop:417 length:291 start_codon:yes stop_codon:yes gene_type:complete